MVLLLCALLPMALGGALLTMRRTAGKRIRSLAVPGAFAVCALAVYAAFTPGAHRFALGGLLLELDAPGRGLFALTAVIYPFAMLFSTDCLKEGGRRFFAPFSCALGALLWMGSAGNLVTMWAGYVLLALFCVPLLSAGGGADGRKAALWGGVSLGMGAALSLIAVICLVRGGWNVFESGGYAGKSAGNESVFLLLGVLGFGALFGLLPLTVWTAKATMAPAPVSALIHGLCGSAGVIAAARLLYDLVPAAQLAPWLPQAVLLLAAASAVFGEVRMLLNSNVEMRMAFSSVSNYAFMLMGLSLMTGAGFSAAMEHMATHAAAKTILFICTGIILAETGRASAREMRGLGKYLKWTFFCFTLAGLSLMGLPPLPGFVSKYALITASFAHGDLWQRAGAFVMAASTVFTAMDIFIVVFPAYCADADLKDGKTFRDCGPAAKWALAALCLLLVGMIFVMGPMLRDFAGIGGI